MRISKDGGTVSKEAERVVTEVRGQYFQSRKDTINGDTMKQYFDVLEDVLTEHNLKDLPSQIYNTDENGTVCH